MTDTPITLIHFVRHGATELTADDRFAGSGIDIPLAPEGRFQAQRLAQRLGSADIRAVHTSPQQRAWSTAQTLSAPHHCDPVAEFDLREIHFGHWEGLTRSQITTQYSDAFQRWAADPFDTAPPGGETGRDVLARALPVVNRLMEQHRGEEVLVVSHKGTIRLVLSALLGIDPRHYRTRLEMDPAALTSVAFAPDGSARLLTYNDTSHYAGTDLAAA